MDRLSEQWLLDLLRCPETGEPLKPRDVDLGTQSGSCRYEVTSSGIPLFAESCISAAGRTQQQHYDRIAAAYIRNLGYPHTQEYTSYLDRGFLEIIGDRPLGVVAELCCGHGEGFRLLGHKMKRGVGVDVSVSMLEVARRDLPSDRLAFVQGDVTCLPLESGRFDTVMMLGGIHHVMDRIKLFSEIFRILKDGGWFVWREPVDDFLPWRMIRAIVYRVSPTLDHQTERPLRYSDTIPPLEAVGFRLQRWKTLGFLGFCVLMNSDVLVVNRLLRFVPGIRVISRLMAKADEATLNLPGLGTKGLLVVGSAVKPASREIERAAADRASAISAPAENSPTCHM